MVEKMKVSQEVADAIEYLKTLGSIEDILVIHSIDADGWAREAKVVNVLTLSELATALIVGYEVEMTPHERIAYEYNYHQERAKDEKNGREKWVGKGYVRGVQRTLKNLNITVEGVNDNG